MADLIQTVMNALPAGATSSLAGILGESPAATTAGVTAAVPALFAGALQKSVTMPLTKVGQFTPELTNTSNQFALLGQTWVTGAAKSPDAFMAVR